MAKSLRGALASRKVALSHSECLEIVARQFGFTDWNTLRAKLPAEEGRLIRSHGAEKPPAAALEARAPDPVIEPASVKPLPEVETHAEMDGTPQTNRSAAPWSTCSFCGKSHPEVRVFLGGCGGWEGFRARRGQPERSNVFICNECVTLAAKLNADYENVLATPVS